MNCVPLPPPAASQSAPGSGRASPPRSKSTHIGGGIGRNLAERLSWSAEDDAKIVASVRQHGYKWRLIASFFDGRSDDAVRNRWHRVKDLPIHNDGREPPPKPALPAEGSSAADANKSRDSSPSAEVAKGSCKAAEAKVSERVSWTPYEDELILRSVDEFGHRWGRIAARLPERTEHAIRNRYSRLQSLVSRGKPIMIASHQAAPGQPIGIQLVPRQEPWTAVQA